MEAAGVQVNHFSLLVLRGPWWSPDEVFASSVNNSCSSRIPEEATMKATFGVFYDGSPNSQKALEQSLFMLQGFPEGTLHLCICVNQPNIDPPFGYLPSEAEGRGQLL